MEEVSLLIRVESFFMLDSVPSNERALVIVFINGLRTVTTINLTLRVGLALFLQIVHRLAVKNAPNLGNNEVHPEDVHHSGDCDRHEHHDEQDRLAHGEALPKHFDDLGVCVAKQNEALEDKTAKEERNQDHKCVDRVERCAMALVGVEKPANADVDGGDLNEEEHYAENHHPIHKH